MKFARHNVQSEVFCNRKLLKGKNISITESLTKERERETERFKSGKRNEIQGLRMYRRRKVESCVKKEGKLLIIIIEFKT